jgi:tyrosyl-tRNA synthetase
MTLCICIKKKIVLQMGGSDQWGNITTGTELLRRRKEGRLML